MVPSVSTHKLICLNPKMAIASYNTTLVFNGELRLLLNIFVAVRVYNQQNVKCKMSYRIVFVPIFVVVKRFLRWTIRIQCS